MEVIKLLFSACEVNTFKPLINTTKQHLVIYLFLFLVLVFLVLKFLISLFFHKIRISRRYREKFKEQLKDEDSKSYICFISWI